MGKIPEQNLHFSVSVLTLIVFCSLGRRCRYTDVNLLLCLALEASVATVLVFLPHQNCMAMLQNLLIWYYWVYTRFSPISHHEYQVFSYSIGTVATALLNHPKNQALLAYFAPEAFTFLSRVARLNDSYGKLNMWLPFPTNLFRKVLFFCFQRTLLMKLRF